ncbi:MAG: hypothetical protein ACAH79_07460, partial [Thermoleophilia bacterium]
MITRATVTVAALAALALSPAMGIGAPSLSDPVLSPTTWSRATEAGALWTQSDFDPALPGPAIVQANSSADGSSSGSWLTLETLAGPLDTGTNGVVSMSVAALEGRHRIRVVVDGALNS